MYHFYLFFLLFFSCSFLLEMTNLRDESAKFIHITSGKDIRDTLSLTRVVDHKVKNVVPLAVIYPL